MLDKWFALQAGAWRWDRSDEPVLERVRALLHDGKLSWSKAKQICRRIADAAPGDERAVADEALRELESGAKPEPRYVLSPKRAHQRLARQLAADPKAKYTVSAQDLFSLLTLLAGKADGDADRHLERVREIFPALVD